MGTHAPAEGLADTFRAVDSKSPFPGPYGRMTERIVISTLVFLCAAYAPTTAGHEGPSQRHVNNTVLHEVFGENVLEQNGSAVRRLASTLSPEDRYSVLRQWVLFHDQRPTLRMEIDFTPANPAPVTDSNTRASGRRLQSGAELVSPAMDLIDTARQLNRLGHLDETVRAWRPPDPEQKIRRAALLAAVAMADHRFDDANRLLQEVFRLTQVTPVTAAERGPEAIATWAAVRHRETREAARDLVFLLYEQARNKVGPRSERWHRQIYSLKQAFERYQEPAADTPDDLPEPQNTLNNWHPAHRSTAETCGKGYPLPRWDLRRGNVSHVTAHDHDYLYYAIPLSGEFAVEADTTTFGYKDIHLGFGNVWAGPGYDLKACLNGNFRRQFSPRKINPPLTQTGDWMRVRLTVEDRIRRTFVNGRMVFECEQPVDGDPWLAIHSEWYANGTIKNLSVSGAPVAPRKITLIARPDLPGWQPYFDESTGQPDSDWHWKADDDGTPELVRRRLRHLAHTHFESLLRYHRPMVEDGSIDYEFFYSPGEFEVCPALDRLAFVLTPSGLKEHWIGDGKFEPSDLDPANSTDNSKDQHTTGRLPLRKNEWNHLRLVLDGDTVRLNLNDSQICSRMLEPTNHRTFGLFLYADQAEARVRNVVWTGNWPKALPDISRQELVDDPMKDINAAMADLPVVLDHRFTAVQSLGQFQILNGAPDTIVREQPDGLHVSRPGGEGYLKYAIAPRLQLKGDFVVTAEFENLKTQPSSGGDSNLQLYVAIDDSAFSECRLYRRTTTGARTVGSSIFKRVDDQTRYLFPKSTAEEATSGKLRLLRHGNKLYYLFAENDSRRFRLVDTQDVGTEPVSENGIRMVVETVKQGLTEVVWKRLTIRAADAAGREPAPPAMTVAELNRTRDSLPMRFEHDFTKDTPSADNFQPWGGLTLVAPQPKGLRLVAPGSEQWTAVGLSWRRRLHGNFDVALKLNPEKMDLPRVGDDTAMMLQTEFEDEPQTAIEIKYSLLSDNIPDVRSLRRTRNASGKTTFRNQDRKQVRTIHSMRIARRGAFAWLLYRDAADSDWKILTATHVGTADVPPEFLRMHLHTGGEKKESRVWLRQLSIAAEVR